MSSQKYQLSLVFACLLLILAGCSTQSERSAPTTPTETPIPKSAFTIVEGAPKDLAVGVEITWYFRRRDFVESDKAHPYQLGDVINTIEGPGRVRGDILYKSLQSKVSDLSGEPRLLSISDGDTPELSFNSINLGNETDEYYDAYVRKTAQGEYVMFMEVDR